MNWERWRLTRAVTISDPFPLIPLSVCRPSIVWQTATAVDRGRWWTCDCWDNGHCDTTERRGDQDWEPRGQRGSCVLCWNLTVAVQWTAAWTPAPFVSFPPGVATADGLPPSRPTVLTPNKLDTDKYNMHQDAPSIWYDSHLHHDRLLFITYSPI